MKKIIIILCSFIMAGELEVDGNLTVTGGINSPTIDALRDDGDYEYEIYFVIMAIHESGNVSKSGYKKLGSDDFTPSTFVDFVLKSPE